MTSITAHRLALQASDTFHAAAASSSRVWFRAAIVVALLAVVLLALFVARDFTPVSHISHVSGAAPSVSSSQMALMRAPNEGCGAVSLPC
jgi:hypothetical protein